uniref:Uncharacterized protein n=1 Tax=Arcella intermedia TaxID=1963864 RepID=A0A6B2LPS7_9EUKA
MRFAVNRFAESYVPTSSVAFYVKTVELENKSIKLQIWDMPTSGGGQERTLGNYYRGAQGIMVLYDVTSIESFANVESWFKEIDRYGFGNVSVMLVGNKCDVMERKTTTLQGEGLAQRFNVPFIETSAFSCTNVTEAFLQLTGAILHQL